MSYNELVKHLLEKYDSAKSDYFLTSFCSTKNRKIVRSEEGLFIHHIDEDKAIKLSNKEFAKQYPYDYQKANRLVYCNMLEHLLLHVKIAEMQDPEEKILNQIYGFGGAVDYMCLQLNDFYAGYKFSQTHMIAATNCIKDDYEVYIKILKLLWECVQRVPRIAILVSKKTLSSGFYLGVVEKVYKRL